VIGFEPLCVGLCRLDWGWTASGTTTPTSCSTICCRGRRQQGKEAVFSSELLCYACAYLSSLSFGMLALTSTRGVHKAPEKAEGQNWPFPSPLASVRPPFIQNGIHVKKSSCDGTYVSELFNGIHVTMNFFNGIQNFLSLLWKKERKRKGCSVCSCYSIS